MIEYLELKIVEAQEAANKADRHSLLFTYHQSRAQAFNEILQEITENPDILRRDFL